MAGLHIKRIYKEIKQYEADKDNINSNGIHIYWLENNITSGLFTITCLDDESPYYHSLFIFEFNITTKYPFEPPSVKFVQYARKHRMNPNLYVEGKVCLSLLGTWSGPSWAANNSIQSVIKSIQALVLCKNPLCNEPGYSLENNKNLVDAYTIKIYALSYYYHLEKMKTKSYLESGSSLLKNNPSILDDIYNEYTTYLDTNKDSITATYEKIQLIIKEKHAQLVSPMNYHGIHCDSNTINHFNICIE